MKICIISFDFWGYDSHIVEFLSKRKNIEAHHIKLVTVTHDSLKERLINTFSKIFFKRNLKYQKRQSFVIERLKKIGYQDQILVLNPYSFDDETLSFIKKSTKKLITFLYDNLERFPVENKLHFFDKIYSFDDNDIAKYSFERLTNYNYLSFIPQEKQCPQNDVYYITSYDMKRIKQLIPLSKKFEKLGLKSKILVIANRFWKYAFLKYFTKNNIIFSTKKISHNSLSSHYKNTKVILDLMRENQYGLSFRVFEAMALEKKIITDNEKIKNYDFYNPNNILVLDKNFSNLDRSFFETPYESLPIEIYEKYTIKNWIKQVFDLKENGNY